MPSAKDCHTLTSYYEKLYKGKYNVAPIVNRNTARWSFDSILQGIALPEVKGLLEYYFTTNSTVKHSLQWFFYNYDKLIEGRQDAASDTERRGRLRQESEERAKKWRERFGNQGITDDQLGSKE